LKPQRVTLNPLKLIFQHNACDLRDEIDFKPLTPNLQKSNMPA